MEEVLPEPRVGDGKGVKSSMRGSRGFRCHEWARKGELTFRER